MTNFRIYKYKFLIIYISFFYLSSCNINKHLLKDEYLLRNTKIEFVDKENSNEFSSDQFNSIIVQKPNRKLLFNFRLYLTIYNLSNQERINKKIPLKQLKVDRKNEKINQNNEMLLKQDSTSKLKSLKQRSLVLGERFQKRGEPPVKFNQIKVNQTKDQFSKFLFNKGYFHSSITDSISVFKDSQQIELTYFIKVGSPTLINKISYLCEDQGILEYLDSIKNTSLIKKGQIFNTEDLIKERNRINLYLRNRGFYSFNKEFIYFELDSNGLNNQINLTLGFQNYKLSKSDGFDQLSHQKYTIDKINIRILPYDYKDSRRIPDSINTPFLSIYNYQPVQFKKKIFLNSVLLKKGSNYNNSLAEKTYKRLISLGLFKYVNIGFDVLKNHQLQANIDLNPAKVQNLSLSLDGTNNERLFGFQGSLDYSNNNLFHGGEKLMLSFKSSFEIQLLLTDAEQSDISNNLNTREIGPEFHYYLPKYFLINNLGFLRNHINPLTEFTGAFNVQERPDFSRLNQELSFGWVFHEKKNTIWHINPLLLSIVDVAINSSFQEQINSLNDQFILASFQDHVVAGGVYSFEYNDQNINLNTNSFYAKITLESAGGLLFRFHELTQKEKNTVTNSYDFFGIRYAHFQKTTLDFRYYHPISENSKMVYRIYSGIGLPRENLREALPFEKSFFAGGSNSIRAWRARSLGPGSFYDSSMRFDKIGDIKLEGNIECRFPISKWLEGAFFMDFGNIWLMGLDSLRPEGQFKWNNILNDLALGGGFGARLNFEYFILRVDAAIPIRNPSFSNPWIFKSPNSSNLFPVQLNLGIGYPF